MIRVAETLIRRGFALVLLTSVVLLFSSCAKIGSGFDFTYTPHGQDFKNSQIITNGPQAADGTSSLLVVISLMNSDNTPVVGFTPIFQIVSGGGVVSSPCTTSNSNGVSTCVLKSAQAGTKRISVTNVVIVLQADVVFTSPAGGQSRIELASSAKTQSQGNYSITGAVGSVETGIKKVSGNYSLFGSVQGQEFSR